MYAEQTLQESSQLIASPNPGVSTIVNLNFTPRSSISIVFFSTDVVFSILSAMDK